MKTFIIHGGGWTAFALLTTTDWFTALLQWSLLAVCLLVAVGGAIELLDATLKERT